MELERLPGAPQAAPFTEPVGTNQLDKVTCQQHHVQVGHPGVDTIWESLPMHPSDNLGDRTRQGPRTGVKYGRDICLPPGYAPAIPGGSFCQRNLIGSQQQLHHNLHRYGTRLGPAQDLHFFYTRSHLSELQGCELIFSANFQFIFTFK